MKNSISAAMVRYGSRINLSVESFDGYVVATSSATAPVGVQENSADQPLPFEQSIFHIFPGDTEVAGSIENDVVKYGQLVRLVHHTHQRVLCHATDEHAVTLKGNLRVFLGSAADNGSSAGRAGAAAAGGRSGGGGGDGQPRVDRWRVMPRYRLRVEGEVVCHGDPIVLHSTDGEHTLEVAPRPAGSGSGLFFEVSCGTTIEGFQLRLYDGDVGAPFRPSTLRCGDCIALAHTEERKLLMREAAGGTCRLRPPQRGGEAAAWELDPAADEEAESAAGTGAADGSGGGGGGGGGGSAQVLPHGSSASLTAGDVSHLALFVVEGADPATGGAVRADGRHRYRLKSLSSGEYLQLGEGAPVSYAQAGGDVGGRAKVLSPLSDLMLSPPSAGASLTSPMASQALRPAGEGREGAGGGAHARPVGPTALTLTRDPSAPGTLFRLTPVAANAQGYLSNGDGIFLDAPETSQGRLWLVAGPPAPAEGGSGSGGGGAGGAAAVATTLAEGAQSHDCLSLCGRQQKSMRDGLELRRLVPKAMEELSMIRSLLPPLAHYAANMRIGIGDPYQLTEVKENIHHLRRLCSMSELSEQLRAGGGSGDTGGGGGGGLPGPRTGAEESTFNPSWQSKMYNQGVLQLLMEVIVATVRCPYVRVDLLHSADIVVAGEAAAGEGSLSDLSASTTDALDDDGGDDDGDSVAAERFAPMRYSDLGELVDLCFDFISAITASQPTYAESLKPYVDFIVNDCCVALPAALRCLLVLFTNNPLYVELPMARGRLNFFLELLRARHHDADVLHMIRLFALCGEESMVEGQKVILDFFAQEGVAASILCPIAHRVVSAGEIAAMEGYRRGSTSYQQSSSAGFQPGGGGGGMAAAGSSTGSAGALASRFLAQVRSVGGAVVHAGGAVVGMGGGGHGGGGGGVGEADAAAAPAAAAAAAAGDAATNPLSASSTQDLDIAAPRTREPSDHTAPPSPTVVPSAAALDDATTLAATAGGRRMAVVNIPHRFFAEDQTGDSLSVATSTQYRGAGNILAEMIINAANAEDLDGSTFFPLEGLAVVQQDFPEVKDVFVPFLIEQLRLFSALCAGRQTRAGEALVFPYLPRDVILEAVSRGSRLPKALHAAFLEVLSTAVVEAEATLQIGRHTRNVRCVISGTAEDRPAAESYQLELPALPSAYVTAKQEVLDFLGRTPIRGDPDAAAQYLAHLKLTESLLDAGAFALSEYELLSSLLVRRLHPDHDDHSTYIHVRVVHTTRVRMMRVLHQLFDILLAMDAMAVVECFRTSTKWERSGQLVQLRAAPQLYDLMRKENKSSDIREEEGGSSGDDTAAVAPSTKDRAVLDADGGVVPRSFLREGRRRKHAELKPVADLFTALQVLAVRTRSTRVRQHALQLFFRLTSYMEELFVVSRRVQLLTSTASIALYTAISQTAAELEMLCRRSFRRANTRARAHNALDAIDGFFDTADEGALIEKLAMMRHVQLPRRLLHVLERLPLPVDDTIRPLVFRLMGQLQAMAQDPAIRDDLRRQVPRISPLCSQDANVLPLLHLLYVQDLNDKIALSPVVIMEVVRCLYTPHSVTSALDLLCDILAVKNTLGHPLIANQRLVWRAMVSDVRAIAPFHFFRSWCHPRRGRRLREHILTGPDYYLPAGHLAQHLMQCRLLFLITHRAELVQPAEVRHEAFGMHALDALLEITTDLHLPCFFRAAYVYLLQSLVLEEAAMVPLLFAHRLFPEFVRLCMMDCAHYLQLRGGTNAFPEVEEELSRRADTTVMRPPQNDMEQALHDTRFGDAVVEDLVFGGVCGCFHRLCECFLRGTARLPSRQRSLLRLCLNEVVDVLCDIVQLHVADAQADQAAAECSHPALAPPSAPILTHAQLRRLAEVLRTARAKGFDGTGRWRGVPLEQLLSGLQAALSARHASSSSSAAAAFSPLGKHRGGGGGAAAAALSPSEAKVVMGDLELPDSMSSETDAPPHLQTATATAAAAAAVTARDSHEHALSERWTLFLEQTFRDAPAMQPVNLCVSAAGLMLRSGDRGTAFAQTLCRALPTMPPRHIGRVLHIIRQLVITTHNNPYDDSAILPFEDVTVDQPGLSVMMSLAARQSLLCRWRIEGGSGGGGGDDGAVSLAACGAPGKGAEPGQPLLSLVTEFCGAVQDGVRRAALETSTTLLAGGHRGMQESLYRAVTSTSEEQLFFVLRNHMSGFLDELRLYRRALRNGSDPLDAQHLLPHMETCMLELSLIRLMCAGQFRPLQLYLVAQEDNAISVNIIESLVELLSMSASTCNEATTPFFLHLMATITETLQGPCVANQDGFVAYNAADFLTQLLTDKEIGRGYGAEEPRKANSETIFEATEEVWPRRRRRLSKAPMKLLSSAKGAIISREPAAEQTPAQQRLAERVRSNRYRRQCLTRIHTAALTTLLALIEGRQEPAFTARLLATVDLAVLVRSMDQSARDYHRVHGPIVRVQSRGIVKGDFKHSFESLVQYLRDWWYTDFPTGHEEIQDELALAVSIFIFFRACHDMQTLAATHGLRRGESKARGAGNGPALQDLFLDKHGRTIQTALRRSEYHREIAQKVGKVEVIRDGVLERMYYRILNSSVQNLFKSRREEIILHAVRNSDNERIQDFFKRTGDAIIEINTYTRLRRYIWAYFLTYCSWEITTMTLLVVVAINLLMIAGIRAPTSPYRPGTSPRVSHAMDALGITNICLQGIIVLQALIGPVTVTVSIRWRDWELAQEEKVLSAIRRDMASDRDAQLRTDTRVVRPPWYRHLPRTLLYMALDPTLEAAVLFWAFAILGFAHHNIWHALQLLQLSRSSPVLDNVFTALTQNAKSLIMTFVLLLFVVFIFSTFSFYFFSELFDPTGSRGNGFNCYSMSQCWLVHVDTLRSGGGIGDVTEWPTFYSHDGFGYWYSFFRIAYYVVVCLIVSNLFFGMIVDSLARLRQERSFVFVDQQQKCFICGIERNIFDVVQPGTFDVHIAESHNMWQYIHFLHYLSEKDINTLSGQEAYIRRLVRLRDVTFYPIGLASVLQDSSEECPATAGAIGTSSSGAGEVSTADVETVVRRATDPLRQRLDGMTETLARLAEIVSRLEKSGRSGPSSAPASTAGQRTPPPSPSAGGLAPTEPSTPPAPPPAAPRRLPPLDEPRQ